MSYIAFSVPGDAVSFGTKTTVFRRGDKLIRGTRKTSAAADWQAAVRGAAAAAMGSQPLLEEPVAVVIWCRFALPKSRHLRKNRRPADWKTTKPDGDKIDRLVMDALEGVIYCHDAQVAAHTLVKSMAEQGQAAVTWILVGQLGEFRAPSLPDLAAALFGHRLTQPSKENETWRR